MLGAILSHLAYLAWIRRFIRRRGLHPRCAPLRPQGAPCVRARWKRHAEWRRPLPRGWRFRAHPQAPASPHAEPPGYGREKTFARFPQAADAERKQFRLALQQRKILSEALSEAVPGSSTMASGLIPACWASARLAASAIAHHGQHGCGRKLLLRSPLVRPPARVHQDQPGLAFRAQPRPCPHPSTTRSRR